MHAARLAPHFLVGCNNGLEVPVISFSIAYHELFHNYGPDNYGLNKSALYPIIRMAVWPACRAAGHLPAGQAHSSQIAFRHPQCMSCMELTSKVTLTGSITLEHQAWTA